MAISRTQVVKFIRKGDKGDPGTEYQYWYARSTNYTSPAPPTPLVTDEDLSGYGFTDSPQGVTSTYVREYMYVRSRGADGVWSYLSNGILISKYTKPCVLRGPQEWDDCETGYSFYAGGDGDDYKDIVHYADQYWVCTKSHTKSSSRAPSASSSYWLLGDKVELIAARVLLAEYASLAGWIFQNNRLESQDGGCYLDGVNGEVKVTGHITASSMRLKVIPSGGKLTDGAFIVDNSSGATYTAPQLSAGEVVEVKFIIPMAATRSFYGFTLTAQNSYVKFTNTFKTAFGQSSISIDSDYCGYTGILIGVGYSSTQTIWTLSCV